MPMLAGRRPRYEPAMNTGAELIYALTAVGRERVTTALPP
jgi:hypothetical protein